MGLSGIELTIWLAGGFALACIFAMLCRGLGKSTERNPEFLAAMGFFWSILPAMMFGASRYFAPLDVGFLAPFGYVLGIVPVIATMSMRTDTQHAPPMFGHDDQGRMFFLGCRTEEVVKTVLYTVLVYELATIFLWDELYR